jgi:hypothetical protein
MSRYKVVRSIPATGASPLAAPRAPPGEKGILLEVRDELVLGEVTWPTHHRERYAARCG